MAEAHWISSDHLPSLDSDCPDLGQMAPSSACVSVCVCVDRREIVCVHARARLCAIPESSRLREENV